MTTTGDNALTSRAWAEIDLAALASNVGALRACLPEDVGVMAVVKADAYGHGLIPVASVAQGAGARWLGVATVAEGARLRCHGLTAPIALLCVPAPAEARDIAEQRLTAVVGDAALASALAISGRHGLEVHLDIDTGIGRSGVQPADAVELWRHCVQRGLSVTGLCTHFADADAVDPDFSFAQLRMFAAARGILADAGARFDWVHAGNSPALLRFSASRGNLVRPGLLLYGIRPANTACFDGTGVESSAVEPLAARPVLALKARVGAVRDLPAGHTVSYGATCRLTRPTRAATVLIGYGDGYPRRLSGCGTMLLKGVRAPILGRVCMDQTVLDVTDIPGVAAGDIAVCIGVDGADTITVEDLARQIDTTEHEITTCLTSRLPRRYLDAPVAACSAPRAEP